jgi:PKD domain
VTVNVGNPTADAGSAQTVRSEAEVTLDATASSDPEGDPLTFSWTQVDGPTVTLTGADTATPTFTAPVGPANLTFDVEVCDPNPLCATSQVSVSVLDPGAPFADAGPDQTVASEALVQLDGTESSDPDGDPLTYSWFQIAGPSVTLEGADTATPSFTALAGPESLELGLQVCDAVNCDTDEVAVTVEAPGGG